MLNQFDIYTGKTSFYYYFTPHTKLIPIDYRPKHEKKTRNV